VLQATRRLLRTGVPPDSAQADERYHAIVSYLAVLSHRGIDTESVLKIALMSDVVVSLVAPALVNLVAPDVDPETAPDGNLSEWGMLLKLGARQG
jgi:hypothetical protein